MNPDEKPLEETFEQLAEHFQHKIYNSPKGELRLALLKNDLAELRQQSGTVLDVGGGLGHLSRWFAEAGHQVTLIDSAQAMLDAALVLNQQTQLTEKIALQQSTLADFPKLQAGYDLVLCHAVLEWLQHPEQAIQQLSQLVNPQGHLSLMFYNQHSLVLRNALRGNLRKVKRADWRGDGKGLTPYQALLPEQVYDWLEHAGLKIQQRSGIRCFYDYLPKKARDTYAPEDILELELNHYRQQPYLHMARYIHVIAEKLAT